MVKKEPDKYLLSILSIVLIVAIVLIVNTFSGGGYSSNSLTISDSSNLAGEARKNFDRVSYVRTDKRRYVAGEDITVTWRVPRKYNKFLRVIQLVHHETGSYLVLVNDLQPLSTGSVTTQIPKYAMQGRWYVRVTTNPYMPGSSPYWNSKKLKILNNNILPYAAITTPSGGDEFPEGSNIVILATASDPDGTVQEVDFLVNGFLYSQAFDVPYYFNWTNVSAGFYSLTAKARDNNGGWGYSEPVNISVYPNSQNILPFVSIIAPGDGFQFWEGSNVNFIGNPVDPDGYVEHIEYYINGKMVYSTPPPWAYVWYNVTPGNYTLRVKAFDNEGDSSWSLPVYGQIIPAPREIIK